MPASRRTRATTLAPRSWPSSPALATTTLVDGVTSECGRLIELTEDLSEHTGDFADRAVGAHTVQQLRHQVSPVFGRRSQLSQVVLHARLIACGADMLQSAQLAGILLLRRLVDGHIAGNGVISEDVDPYHRSLLIVDLTLGPKRFICDGTLNPALLNRRHHPALGLDPFDDRRTFLLVPVGQLFDVPRAAQRVDHVARPGLE